MDWMEREMWAFDIFELREQEKKQQEIEQGKRNEDGEILHPKIRQHDNRAT